MKFKTSKTDGGMVAEFSTRDSGLLSKMAGLSAQAPVPIYLRKILVPLDFSDCSRKAIEYALPFAQQFGASLILLHVLRTPSVIPEDATVELPMLEAQMLETSRRDLADWATKNIDEKISVKTRVCLGSPYREIVETARAEEADVIIMSTHGHTGLKHVFLGSTTESVVRYATCPVFVVREKEHDFVGRKEA